MIRRPIPPPLGSRPLYAYEETFNSGGADLVRNVTATTGWGGSSYTTTRAAAPFAILDAIYSGMQLVLSADANAVFGPMDAFWSVNNILHRCPNGYRYRRRVVVFDGLPSVTSNSLFLLGDANAQIPKNSTITS